MKASRARFKYSLRICRRHEAEIRADALAQHLLEKDFIQFWKDVDKSNCKRLPLSESVGGVSGHENIANLWRSHYETLFSSVKGSTHKDKVVNNISNISIDCELTSYTEVAEAIKSLDNGKACGSDNIFPEHLKLGGNRIAISLSLCFNAFIVHGFLPDSLMNTVIVPVIKNKSGDVSDTNNYRPIALSSIVSKAFEIILLSRCEEYIGSSDCQFGFKSGHSTDLCIYKLKEIIHFYKSHSSPVFVCYMDATKAFDKINHWTLFNKLIDKHYCSYVILLVSFSTGPSSMGVSYI